MFYFQNNSISENTTTANLLDIGDVKLSEMKLLPFIAPYYKGWEIKRKDEIMCKEFDGDCFKFFEKYIDLKWVEHQTDKSKTKYYAGHVCTTDEITLKHHNTGRLYICPPSDKLIINNNFESYPHSDFALYLKPNYNSNINRDAVQKEMSNFQIAR